MKRTLKSTKSRGGCQRCKASRVKCDETKPGCKVCFANGVDCPGYAQQLRWSNKHEMFGSHPNKQAKYSPTKEAVQKPPIATSSAAATATNESTPASAVPSPSPTSNTPTTAAEGHPLAWPNFEELCGYEDFGFSAPLLEPSFHAEPDMNFGDLFATNLGHAFPPAPAGLNDSPNAENAEQAGHQIVSPSSKSSQKRPAKSSALLQTFYRMSMPSDVPGFSDQDLINHYFNSVCAIYSCYDCDTNPFRSLVGSLWQSDKTIYVNDLRLLRTGKRSTDSVMLSLLLLGPSASWHQATNLGLQYLLIARNLLQSNLQLNKELDEFYINAMMYWEMCVSFVDPVPSLPLSGLKEPRFDLEASGDEIHPHSWTGVANEVCFLLAEIGRVLRRQRGSPTAFEQFYHIEREWFQSLERSLHVITIPTADAVADIGDSRTSKDDLIRCAEALKYVGLLEIYSMFPDILSERISNDLGCLSVIDQFEPLESANDWLIAIALHILNAVKPISISSAACRLFPPILLSASSQVRLDPECSSEFRERVVEARYTVEARMLLLSRKYPQRPFLQMLDIVKEVWERLDNGTAQAHWMNVMHEGGLLTLIC
ncbi:hypothetical protein PRZ48_000237 [Zasmidium cellare]|uniref:Zn(2)-C6 fungal-type domain-containing protein n=1 Tax=Zasmidium cellare TaxID=395010 RepID=A0ABR0EZM2_ZASCE|nr:hypothetical protein PRZ48_000237 [Zasmidium cellare]